MGASGGSGGSSSTGNGGVMSLDQLGQQLSAFKAAGNSPNPLLSQPTSGDMWLNNSNGLIGGYSPSSAATPQSATSSTSDVNALSPANNAFAPPPGNNPYDWFTGSLFQNSGGAQPQGGPGAIPTPAFGGDLLSQLFSGMTGLNYPGPVPTALAPYGTQSSLFGDLTGLGNPLLLPMLLLMANRPTTTVPFDPPVQPGSPDANLGMWPWIGTSPYFPAPGTTLPPWATFPFTPVPPVPGGASNLPGNLPPIGHGPFTPGGGFGFPGGEVGGEEGGGDSGGSRYSYQNTTGGYTHPTQTNVPDIVRYNPVYTPGQGAEIRDPNGNIVYSRGGG